MEKESDSPLILLDPFPRSVEQIFDAPIPADHRARRIPNTLLQAHRAGNISEIWPQMGRLVVDDLEQILKGLPPQLCQRAQWETVAKIRSKPSEQKG